MRRAEHFLFLPLLALAVAACGQAEGERDAAANRSTATDIETLPADESATTSSEDLANGAVDSAGEGTAGQVPANESPQPVAGSAD